MERTLAHISDLYLGGDPHSDASVARIAGALEDAGVDVVLVTGDVTRRGRRCELRSFEAVFARLRDRVVVVPGNHDRREAARRRDIVVGKSMALRRRDLEALGGFEG